MRKQIPVIELFLTIITGWWAIALLLNDKLFESRPELFYTFQKVANEEPWGSIFVLISISLILGLIDGQIWLRRLSLVATTFLYGLMTAGFILSKQPLSTGIGVYFAIAVLSLWRLREVKEDE